VSIDRSIDLHRRNWPLIIGTAMLGVFILTAIFADLIAPYDAGEQSRREPAAPAATIAFADGHPIVKGVRMTDPISRTYEIDETRPAEIRFFTRGYHYRLLGVLPLDVHLFGTENADDAVRINLLGTDDLGRDRFSRLLAAIRFSLIVCPLGALLASVLGVLIGTASGYAGHLADTAIMGVTDAVISLPSLIIILAARVAFPLELPPLTAAAMLITIFTLTGWAEMARLARGLVRKTRGTDYIAAAKVSGVRPAGILFRHILPNIARPLITQATLILPAFLLAEAALSYLGVGLQEPAASLGNMLSSAGDIDQLKQHPLLLLSPAIAIALFVLAVRLLNMGIKEKDASN